MLVIALWKPTAAAPGTPVVGKRSMLATKYLSCSNMQSKKLVVEIIIGIHHCLEALYKEIKKSVFYTGGKHTPTKKPMRGRKVNARKIFETSLGGLFSGWQKMSLLKAQEASSHNILMNLMLKMSLLKAQEAWEEAPWASMASKSTKWSSKLPTASRNFQSTLLQ